MADYTLTGTSGNITDGSVMGGELKLNITAGAPTVNDDITKSYGVGSRWIDTADQEVYVLVDNTEGSAVWVTSLKKSIYDANNNNIVDKAESLNDGTNISTAEQVADTVSKAHIQNTDQYLDYGGANQVSAADAKSAVDLKHTQNTDTGTTAVEFYIDTTGDNLPAAKNNLSNVDDTTVLDKVKNVDGDGSGLDADLLDGKDSSLTPTANTIPVADSNGDLSSWIKYYSLKSFYYDGSTTHYYWSKVGKIDQSSSNNLLIEVIVVTNFNYPNQGKLYVSFNSYNGSVASVFISQQGSILNSQNLISATIDNDGNCWIYNLAVWNSYAEYRLIRKDGNAQFYTDASSNYVEDCPTTWQADTKNAIRLNWDSTNNVYTLSDTYKTWWDFSSNTTIEGNTIWHNGNTPVSEATNGYQKLPNGLIIQWGNIQNGANPVNVTFPIVFPNARLVITAILNKYDSESAVAFILDNSTVDGIDEKSGAHLWSINYDGSDHGSTTDKIYWIAIGY